MEINFRNGDKCSPLFCLAAVLSVVGQGEWRTRYWVSQKSLHIDAVIKIKLGYKLWFFLIFLTIQPWYLSNFYWFLKWYILYTPLFSISRQYWRLAFGLNIMLVNRNTKKWSDQHSFVIFIKKVEVINSYFIEINSCPYLYHAYHINFQISFLGSRRTNYEKY